MKSRQNVNTESTLTLVNEESVEGCFDELLIDDVMIQPAVESEISKICMKVEAEKPKSHQINSSLSIVNKGQIIVALGIWVASIIGISKADGVKAEHIASLLSTAIFISAGYIGIRALRKPIRLRILLYIGLCISSFTYGIVMAAINIHILVKEPKGKEIIISETVFDFVEIVLAATGSILIRRKFTTVRVTESGNF